MADKKRCRTNLIPDDPAIADAFGSHGRVADAIVEVVRTEVGGKSIGLEGGWGSGKSTIVRLVRDKLTGARNGEHEVFVFDTWAHQGDPLRRTFLENLISDAEGWKGVDAKKWGRHRDELAKRRREETKREVPRLTVIGVVFALLLLAIPLGAALISAGATLLASETDSAKWEIVFVVLGIVLLLSSVIFYVGLVLSKNLWAKLKTCGKKKHECLEELPALVTGQASTETHTIVTQSPDPTSVEFATVFRDLLEDVLNGNARKLLLVIDNLDRVQPSDALSIWSTMQTFLGHSEGHRPEWFSRVWVLVPYDGNAILRLWKSSDRNTKEDLGANGGGQGTISANSTFEDSFLDKTFQLRFRVPQLLLSKWRDFLETSLIDALPCHGEKDFEDIYRAYGVNGGVDKSTPTPRALKIFANQIGALHRERQHEFSLSDYACYVLLKKNVENVHDVLLSEDDDRLMRRFMENQWKETIAAIHFGVSVGEGRQLLLKGRIETALVHGGGSILSNLAAENPEGFWAVLDASVPRGAENWSSLDPREIALAATALVNSGVFDHTDDRPEADFIRRVVRNAALSVSAWGTFDATNAKGLVAIVRLVDDPEVMIPGLMSRATNAFRGPTSPGVWMASAMQFVNGLVKFDFEDHIGAGMQIPLDAEDWLEVSSEIAESDPDGRILQYFELQNTDQIDQRLSELFTIRQFNDVALRAVKMALATRSRSAFENTAKAALNLLERGGLQADQLTNAMQALRVLDSANLFNQGEYANIATSGRFLSYLSLAYRNGNQLAVAECMFGYLRFVPDGRITMQSGDSQHGLRFLTGLFSNPNSMPDVVQHFAKLVAETRQSNFVFEMASGQNPVNQFTTEVLRKVLNATGVSMPNELARENWRTIREALGTGDGALSFETFLKRLQSYQDLVVDITDGEFDAGESGLYLAMLDNDADPGFGDWCGNGLITVDKGTWAKEFASPGDIVRLVTDLDAGGADLKLGLACFDALVERAEAIAVGEGDLLTKPTWHVLVNSLDLDRQKLFPSDVHGILEKSEGNASEKFFGLFGEMLSSRELLAGRQGFIPRVCRRILEADNEGGIAWLADIAVKDPQVFKAHRDQIGFTDFADRVRQNLDATPRDGLKHRNLRRIEDALGI